ncbi:MAG: AbrB/MazE/SpoVT family DNA-binding domain-containing protein [Erysipelotrichia bacterium]|nr:AbrB/MazE/SpoVT family DNA-binding domain-containing protein [Erysipelotrichia bacterium]NCC54022.1 AbrB/MazE/SpoVT family DNA-binding domain-containing protein [Erysipelotrichia bacterium]
MKETGMVRKLDDLGRLVIPKEIRKMYKMKEGDAIEIYIKDGSICIRKFDETSSFYEQIYHMCEVLKEKYTNKVFFSSEEYLKQNHIQLEEKMIDRAKTHTSVNFENVKVFIDDEQRYSGCIVPIIAYGDYFGSFIMVYNIRVINEEGLLALQLFAKLLASQQH